MINDYIWTTDKMFFKHEISENLPCNTYSMHTHNAYELIYFLDGDATHVIEDRKYKLKKGDLILIRPFLYHFIQIDTPAR
jgi:cupin superfamily acireductone dioxygenase involved in methionine salvage